MLSNKQIAVLTAAAVFFWVVFAVIIRSLPAVFDGSWRNVLLYLFTLTLGWFLVSLVQWLGKLEKDQVVTGCLLAFAVAFLLDGLVLVWLPEVYGGTALHVRSAAGFIVWSSGVTFLMAMVRWHRGWL